LTGAIDAFPHSKHGFIAEIDFTAAKLMGTEDRKSFLLRVDPEVWRELEKWAADELRSVNGQVEYLLRQAVQKRKKTQGDEEDESAVRKRS
jgi:hypothetical protein